jgi:hypothetical protein
VLARLLGVEGAVACLAETPRYLALPACPARPLARSVALRTSWASESPWRLAPSELGAPPGHMLTPVMLR